MPCGWYNGAWPAISLLPPRQKKAFHEAVLQEILQERVSSSRHRLNPRGVKRKMRVVQRRMARGIATPPSAEESVS